MVAVRRLLPFACFLPSTGRTSVDQMLRCSVVVYMLNLRSAGGKVAGNEDVSCCVRNQLSGVLVQMGVIAY